jgi:hypothetical protein
MANKLVAIIVTAPGKYQIELEVEGTARRLMFDCAISGPSGRRREYRNAPGGRRAGGTHVLVLPGPERNHISIEGRIVENRYRTMDEGDGSYIWGSQFGFWVEREALAAAVREVKWVRHYTG